MIRDLGIVQPGTTLYIPFHTFDSNDPSASVTLTGLATTDIEIYKDGSVTQRASDSGYALLDTDGIDFDATTGIHGISIDLADNTTAGFYAAGSQYWVVIASVTVDAATVNFVLCTFRIGYPNARLNTTIATLASQTSFTLTTGPAEDNALNNCWCIIHDVASGVQCGHAVISSYTGATKTVTLAAGTTFTAAATDNISVMGPMPIQPTVAGRTLDVSTGGEAGVDWANVGSPTTTLGLTNTTVGTVTTLTGHTAQTGDCYSRLGAPAGASVSADIASLSSQIGAIAVVGTAINTVAESYTLTTGTQTSGTYASTALVDATPHTHTDSSGTMDLYYQFDVGVQGIPVSTQITAYSNGSGDDLSIQAYNFGSTTWETVGTLVGKSGSTYDQHSLTLLTRHVGTGANIGKVRIRFYSASLTSATLRVDQIVVSYSISQAFQYVYGYVDDASATTTAFNTSLTQANDFFNDALLIFTSGALSGQSKPVQDFVNTNGRITLDEALTSAPANGVSFIIKADHIHPVSQIQSGLATATELATANTNISAILADTGTDGVVVATGSKTGYSLTATTGLGNQTANITGNLSGSVGSVTGMTASDVGAIKAKTDSLTFTQTGHVDANVQRINDVTITGDGGATPFNVV